MHSHYLVSFCISFLHHQSWKLTKVYLALDYTNIISCFTFLAFLFPCSIIIYLYGWKNFLLALLQKAEISLIIFGYYHNKLCLAYPSIYRCLCSFFLILLFFKNILLILSLVFPPLNIPVDQEDLCSRFSFIVKYTLWIILGPLICRKRAFKGFSVPLPVWFYYEVSLTCEYWLLKKVLATELYLYFLILLKQN